jgi:hypothetical protein
MFEEAEEGSWFTHLTKFVTGLWSSSDPYRIHSRFVKKHAMYYETALEEITAGRKCSCWMWYVAFSSFLFLLMPHSPCPFFSFFVFLPYQQVHIPNTTLHCGGRREGIIYQ